MFMIATQGWIEPTRAVGLLAYATAVMCCGLAWFRTKAQRQDARLAASLTLIESALFLDMAFNWRWKLHQALLETAMQKQEYDQRSLPQQLTLILLGGLLLIGFAVAWRLLRSRGTTLMAVWGAMASVVLWCTEVVSLHAVDHVLYQPLGGVKAVSALWVLACAMTSIGVLLDPH